LAAEHGRARDTQERNDDAAATHKRHPLVWHHHRDKVVVDIRPEQCALSEAISGPERRDVWCSRQDDQVAS
jgi:hypothetical protein